MRIESVVSAHYDERPHNAEIDTIVIHTMHNPDSSTPFDMTACKDRLDCFAVSAHYLISRAGAAWLLVPEEERARHAGASRMHDGREAVNDFSIGIELVASETEGPTAAQYTSCADLVGAIAGRHPIRFVVGHSHIAPERKTDPWGFDWERLLVLLNERGISLPDPRGLFGKIDR